MRTPNVYIITQNTHTILIEKSLKKYFVQGLNSNILSLI